VIYRLEERRVRRHKDTYIAPNATVIGSVELHEGASIWFNAVVRGDNDPIVIGREANIQDAAVLHTDIGVPLTIGRGVTVGHKVMLHGCTIGDYALIGINAVVLNRAKVGPYCIIGANSLIGEGKEIPEGSLVMGTPGRVVRALSPAERLGLEHSAAIYVANARRYLTGLTEDQG
jgi:carbonic anhydrase/acetyltransferase-like protein (isoleucine patch superfamily)